MVVVVGVVVVGGGGCADGACAHTHPGLCHADCEATIKQSFEAMPELRRVQWLVEERTFLYLSVRHLPYIVITNNKGTDHEERTFLYLFQ